VIERAVPGRALYRALWHTAWSAAALYHRYQCEGFEHIERCRPALLISYHGRPYTMDLYMLAARMQRELGRMPRFVVLKSVESIPPLRDMVWSIGSFFDAPDDATVRALSDAGELFAICPGGTREAFRPAWRGRYRVDFGERRGYLRFALRHRLPVLPSAAVGVDGLYLGLNDGYAWSRRVFGHGKNPLWLGLGVGGLWPLAAPWPVKIRQRVGPPITFDDLAASAVDEEALLAAAHARVTAAIQALLDELRAR
jgi:1-acyl-sn-glycerol-3-phosphate acyltransferase